MPVYETSSTVFPRADLAGAYSAFDAVNQGFVADFVLPRMSINEEAGVYTVIPREVWTQRVDTKVASKAASSTADWTTDNDTFQLVEYRHKGLVVARDARRYRSFFDAEEIETRRVAGVVARDREIDTATAVFNTTTFGTAGVNRTSLSTPWDVAGGTPVTDVEAAKFALVKNYGTLANTLIITYYGLSKLMMSTEFKGYFTDMFGDTLIGLPPTSALQRIFGLENIIVPRGIYNSANPGATMTAASIWDEDYAMVCRIESGMDLNAPQLGRTLTLDGMGPEISSWENDDPEGVWIRAKELIQPKLTKTPVGHLISNTKT
jgi:hypothetical protein